MVSSHNTVKPINKHSVVPPIVTLVITPTKVLNKRLNTRQIATIRRSQLNTAYSAIFLSTALHSVSQAIIHAHTSKISLYNKSDIDFCGDSRASKDMFPDCSILKTYRLLSNRYATIGNTTKLPIEGIGSAV